MKSYDVIVIGSGGGAGFAVAAGKAGKTVALIEKAEVGGTCLNRGCIPSKMFIHPSQVALEAQRASEYQVNVSGVKLDLPALSKRIAEKVSGVSEKSRQSYRNLEIIDFYEGHARFIDNKVIEVNGEELQGETILIATGSRPQLPDYIQNASFPYMTSKEALLSEEAPKRLVILGGGYIACELSTVFHAAGSEITFIVRSGMLKREDIDIRTAYKEAVSEMYAVHENTTVQSIVYSEEKKEYTLVVKTPEGEQTIVSDGLLVATGVVPNADEIGLEKTDITKTPQGFIEVNESMQTVVPGVYAIGDVVGNFLFRHSVNFERDYLIDALVKGNENTISYPPMPSAVFSYPEIASVGLREDDLALEGRSPDDYVIGISKYAVTAQGWARASTVDLAKVIVERNTGKIVGAHIIGEESSTMIHILSFAMGLGSTVHDLSHQIFVHPALPEVIKGAIRKARNQL